MRQGEKVMAIQYIWKRQWQCNCERYRRAANTEEEGTYFHVVRIGWLVPREGKRWVGKKRGFSNKIHKAFLYFSHSLCTVFGRWQCCVVLVGQSCRVCSGAVYPRPTTTSQCVYWVLARFVFLPLLPFPIIRGSGKIAALPSQQSCTGLAATSRTQPVRERQNEQGGRCNRRLLSPLPHTPRIY